MTGRRRSGWIVAALATAGLSCGGNALKGAGESCTESSECGAGLLCDLGNHECEMTGNNMDVDAAVDAMEHELIDAPKPDGGTKPVDAGKPIDASKPIDAEPIDAEPIDAGSGSGSGSGSE